MNFDQVRAFYKEMADKFWNPNMVNDYEDEEALIGACKRCMDENRIALSEDEDEWLEFVYRAGEICEIADKGYYYHRVKKPNGDWDYVLETAA